MRHLTSPRRTAILSDDRLYRYLLARYWSLVDTGHAVLGGELNVIMLNPSTADETVDGLSIRRCIGLAQRTGHDRLTVTNLFAWRATKPRELRSALWPIGPQNDQYLLQTACEARTVVVAWGNHGAHHDRSGAVLAMLFVAGIVPQCLGVTGALQPKHPLYVPNTAELVPFRFGPFAEPDA